MKIEYIILEFYRNFFKKVLNSILNHMVPEISPPVKQLLPH